MDLFSDVKMLVLLLACLASTCGRPTGLPNQGHSKNGQQQPSSIDTILKAVLVHESTGNGVHSGSVRSGTGDNLKVTKQNEYRAGESSSTGYSYSAKTGLQNIRAFHKSHGDTGYSQPQAAREAPRGFSTNGSATSKVNPDQALKSFHDLLFRPRSEQNLGRGQALFGSSGFVTSSPSEGYRYENPKQSAYFYAAPRHAESGFGGGFSSGQYTSAGQPLNAGYAAVSGYPSNGYQYPSPVQTQKARFANDNLSNAQSNSVRALNRGSEFESSNNAASVGYSGYAQNGFQFSNPNKGLGSGGLGTFSGSVFSLNERPKAFNGYQYASPSHAPKPESFRYEKPVSTGYNYEKHAAADKIAISQFVSSLAQLNSENLGYRYNKPIAVQSIKSQGGYKQGNTVSDGYQYLPQSQSIPAPHQFGQPSNVGFNTPLHVNVVGHQTDQSSNPGFNFNGFAQPFDGSHNFEQPQSYSNDGYRYDQPNKPDSAKSIFKGQPYLPQPPANKDSYKTNGYRYDKPDESSRPKTVFKGQPYLPIPPVSGGF